MNSFVKPKSRKKLGLGAASTAALVVSPFTVLPVNAATFTVTSCDDSGAGTFRQAVLDANSSAGADVISFSLTGNCTINVESTITITEAVEIDNNTAYSVTLRRTDEYVFVPGYNEPGQYIYGTYHPGYNMPGYFDPGYNMPGYNMPGWTGPGWTGPGHNSPGECRYMGSSYTSSSCTMPYQYYPGTYFPGNYYPGTYYPGYYVPGEYVPGEYVPGDYVPPYTEPGFYQNGAYHAPSSYTNQNTEALVEIDIATDGSTVTIEGVDFDGATENATEASLVITDNGVSTTVTLAYAEFSNARARAIENLGSYNQLHVSYGSFSNNESTLGGAIYSTGALEIYDSTFNSNSATKGGAVAIVGGSLTIYETDFSSNEAVVSGGALYMKGNYALFQDSGITFSYNIVSGNGSGGGKGGAIYAREGSNGFELISHARVTITNNRAGTDDGETFNGYGAGIYLAGGGRSSATFNGEMFFTYNTSEGEIGSGAALSVNATNVTEGSLDVAFNEDVTFQNNSASYGGAVYLGDWPLSSDRDAESIDLLFAGTTTTFSYNSATQDGGAMHLNSINSSQQVHFNSEYTYFNSNTAGYDGGAIYVINSHRGMEIDAAADSSIDFTYNSAGINGGAIAVFADGNSVQPVSINFGSEATRLGWVQFKSNTADSGYGGGAVSLKAGLNKGAEAIEFTINSDQLRFGYNSASGSSDYGTADGGAIYARSAGVQDNIYIVLESSNASLYSNSAQDSGGFLSGQNTVVNLIKTTEEAASFSMTYNSAQYGYGGALFMEDGIFIGVGLDAASNSSAGSGGFLYLDTDNEISSRIYSSHFSYNSSAFNGGVVQLQAGELAIHDSKFDANSASGRGGVISVQTSASLYLYSNLFYNNSAGHAGGVMYTKYFGSPGSNRTLLFMTNNTITENRSNFVGGLSLGNTTYGTLVHNTFANNYSWIGDIESLYSSLALGEHELAIAANIFAGSTDLREPFMVTYANASDGGANLFTGPAPEIDGVTVANYDAALRDGHSVVVTLEQLDLMSLALQALNPVNDGAWATMGLDSESVAIDFIESDFMLSPIWGMVGMDARGVDRLDESSNAIWGNGLDSGAFESIHTFAGGGDGGGDPDPEPEIGSPDPVAPNLSITSVSKHQLNAGGDIVQVHGVGLRLVDRVTIGGMEVGFTLQADGSLLLATGQLPAGTHTLIVASEVGTASLLQAFTVSAEASYWTKNLGNGQAKLYAKNIVGEGKVQFILNGKEIAWINAVDESDPKLRKANGAAYLVRTVNLVSGKNRLEVKVDGVRVRFTTYTK